jgi:uncharacterized protein (DUF849 family)
MAPDNGALVKLAVKAGKNTGRHVADADDVRQMLF